MKQKVVACDQVDLGKGMNVEAGGPGEMLLGKLVGLGTEEHFSMTKAHLDIAGDAWATLLLHGLRTPTSIC